MTSSDRVQRTFPPHESSIADARRFVRANLQAWGISEVTDLAVLATSELVTNGVVHAGTPVRVTLTLADSALRLEVQDSHADRALPLQWVAPPEDSERGRGLLIASALAPSWGVEYTRTDKTVWLAFPLPSVGQAAPGSPSYHALPKTTAGTITPVRPRSDALGLPEEALNRLGLDDYLDLAVERARDLVRADAAYLMLARGTDLEYEIRAVSGLDGSLLGTHVDARAPGSPDARNPHLPVVITDLARSPVPFLADTDLRSLVVVPVTVDGRVTGGLAAASTHVAGFSDAESGQLQRIADGMAVAADRVRLRAAERERRGWLSFVAEAGDLLAGSLDQRMTMAVTGQIVVPRLASWCAIYLDDERQVPRLQQVWHRDERLNAPLRSVLAETSPDDIGASGDAVLAGEVLAVPLIARAQRIGTLVLGRDKGDPLTGEVLLVAESVSRRAALAIDNARAHGELHEVGAALQRSLLPSSLPDAPALDVGVVYQAAGEASTVGGDFYDLFAVGGGRWCFVVGDVCGTGAEAAAVTGLARHTIRALGMAGFPVPDILERLNSAILDEGERARFLTLVAGILQPVGGGRALLTMVCAGHPPPFLVRADGQVGQVGHPQSLLGVFDDVAFTAEEHVLMRGDLLVAVTDGVLERRDGTRFLDEDGLALELGQDAHLPAQSVADRIRRLVLDFAPTPQLDDMAILALRFVG